MPTTYPSPNAIVTPNVSSSASVNVAPANLQRIGFLVFNPSSTVVLWVAPGQIGSGTTAAVGGSGSIAVQPLQQVVLGLPLTPAWTNGLNAIAASGPTNTITVLEFTQ